MTDGPTIDLSVGWKKFLMIWLPRYVTAANTLQSTMAARYGTLNRIGRSLSLSLFSFTVLPRHFRERGERGLLLFFLLSHRIIIVVARFLLRIRITSSESGGNDKWALLGKELLGTNRPPWSLPILSSLITTFLLLLLLLLQERGWSDAFVILPSGSKQIIVLVIT